MHASQVISRALHAPLLIRHVVHLIFEINCENCRIRSRALAFGTVAVVRQQQLRNKRMSASCFCCSANGSVIVVAFARRKRGKTNFPPMVSIQSCVGISIGRERFLRTTKITVQLASALNVINYAVKQKRKKKNKHCKCNVVHILQKPQTLFSMNN